jgi:hypothetical protein
MAAVRKHGAEAGNFDWHFEAQRTQTQRRIATIRQANTREHRVAGESIIKRCEKAT